MAVNFHPAACSHAQITGQIEAVFQKAPTGKRSIGHQCRRQAHNGATEGDIERLPPAANRIDQIITDRDRTGCTGHDAVEDRYGATRHGTGGKRDAGGVVYIKILKSRKCSTDIRKVDILIVCPIENYLRTGGGEYRACA